ncbi:NUDIX hydrolase [Azospirillum thermophilum]|uniref:NUDIX hydrolase n=1 Tax=Azospirillum thermophilum TaxID=2202148 RepID=A0A2S2CXT3_9PROT|nr:NUDIX hydrolase [Azospirillum thermophilum]AWK89323.1 NUDIX hydrolase [Azospirillum thermophilum]
MENAKPRTQYAALPVSMTDGGPRVLLVTSRETRRWIIPKGWPKKGVKPHKLAALEAYEEAGIVGKASKRPLGSFRYDKRLTETTWVPCRVDVFLLKVTRELDDWPEKDQRRRRWLAPTQAARLVSEADLVDILLALEEETARSPSKE